VTKELDRLIQRYPVLWDQTGRDMVASLEKGAPAVASLLQNYSKKLFLAPAGSPREEARLKNRLLRLALDQTLHAALVGPQDFVKFNLWNGLLLQALFFRRGLERKPASLFWTRLLWPFLTQRRLLMPLVQPRGVYCFYSREFIKKLTALIAGRPCVEIAAGDGTLTRFLKEAGVSLTAIDDFSWSRVISYPPWVEKRSVGETLSHYRPSVVLCSWPPPGNSFEKQVFACPSVDLYIVIGSRHRFASGNPEVYQRCAPFQGEEDKTLSAQILPPELDSAVFVFRREISEKPRDGRVS